MAEARPPEPSPAGRPSEPARLADHTTLRLGGPATEWVRVTTEAELVDAVRTADDQGTPTLVLAGGSNLVVADDGFAGRVVEIDTTGVAVEGDACGGAYVTVAAGENWDELVARAGTEGWVGVEALSGIPGSVGATPIQNVGAYGQEVSETVARVRAWDRIAHKVTTFANADCGFGYRTSRFKKEPARFVVLDVTFQLRLGDLGAPVRYAELAKTLDTELDTRAPLTDVRKAVLMLRRSKGMVLDADDHDTWSAGSFFTNPVLPADEVPDGAPAWPHPSTADTSGRGSGDGRVKTSAAWLIEQAGFEKGYARGRVALSTKHTLALTNRGGATTDELMGLASEVRDGVRERFGVTLVNEPVLVGCAF